MWGEPGDVDSSGLLLYSTVLCVGRAWGQPGDVDSSGTSSVSDIEWVHCDQSWKGLVQLMLNNTTFNSLLYTPFVPTRSSIAFLAAANYTWFGFN